MKTMKRYRWDQKYLHWGVTAFVVIAASILFYAFVNNLAWLRGALRTIGGILSPFIWGLVIAYLLYPLMKLYSRSMFLPLSHWILKKHPKKDSHIPALARGLSVFLCIISLLVLIAGLVSLVVPQLVSSIVRIIENGSSYIDRAGEWLKSVLRSLPGDWSDEIADSFGNLSNELLTLATEYLPQLQSLMDPSNMTETISSLTKTIGSVGANVFGVFRGIYNVLIGIIVSVYMLYSQETFAARVKKLLYCVFSVEASEKILDGARFTNQVFMGFLSGKILDSFLVGILCFIGCSLLRIPYALLVSVVVGITNIIPFFGPFIGAVPSVFIILTESPLKALIFLIFVVVLQQFDGNILGPKILGNRIGINGFWVLFAIILGAGLFGFGGMLLGVPVFVIIYTGIEKLIERKLARSGLPTETEAYEQLHHIDVESGRPIHFDPDNETPEAVESASGVEEKQEGEKPPNDEPKT